VSESVAVWTFATALPFGSAAGSAGLTNMRDRVTAVGGELDLASAPGQGAVVTGSVPIAA
jgi:signal transduction histidine kinase